LGPGLITGCADDDPSGISTHSMAGAAFGSGLLWTALISLPLMVSLQIMCGRVGDRIDSPIERIAGWVALAIMTAAAAGLLSA
jgi:Mn2+/Fe2+ NRAMP family transporter